MKISSEKMSKILFEVWLDNFLYYFFDKVAYFSLHTFSPRLWIQTPDSLCIALFICNRDMKYNVAKNIGKFFSVHATALFFCVHLGVFLGLQCWQCQCSACEIPSVSVVEGGGRQAEMSPSGDGRGLHRHGAQEGGMVGRGVRRGEILLPISIWWWSFQVWGFSLGDRLIFIMGILILVRRHIYIETAPGGNNDKCNLGLVSL